MRGSRGDIIETSLRVLLRTLKAVSFNGPPNRVEEYHAAVKECRAALARKVAAVGRPRLDVKPPRDEPQEKAPGPVHLADERGPGLFLWCGKTAFEVPISHRVTTVARGTTKVTCVGCQHAWTKAKREAEARQEGAA